MTRVEELMKELHAEIVKGLPNSANVSVYVSVQQHVHQAHDKRRLGRSLHEKLVGDAEIDRIHHGGSSWYKTHFDDDKLTISTFYQ